MFFVYVFSSSICASVTRENPLGHWTRRPGIGHDDQIKILRDEKGSHFLFFWAKPFSEECSYVFMLVRIFQGITAEARQSKWILSTSAEKTVIDTE